MMLSDLFLRIRALVSPRRVDRELDEELAFHIERETQKHIDAGLTPADARRRAQARFGSVPLAADECRDARGINFVDDLVRDVLYALRSFRRAPLAALTIVATVALGLGLVTAVFVVYNIFVLRTDAVRSPGELFAVQIDRVRGGDFEPHMPITRRDYDAMRRETSVFADAVAMADAGGHVDGRFARAFLVTGNFFQTLGVQAALGRPLLPDDDERGAGRPVIVLSHAGWHKLFAGDRTAIGRRVQINRAPYEIVGVMPEGFRGLGVTPPDYWAPLALAGQFRGESVARAEELGLEVIGRLKPGVSREAASAALAAWASGRPELNKEPGRPLQAWLSPRTGTIWSEDLAAKVMLFSPPFFAFGLILLIGCANVANLLLARGVSRQREIGIRLSLGASRPRIIRQLLTESLLLALVAAACGVVVSRLFLDGALHAALTTMPPEVAQFVGLFNLAFSGLDWRMVVFLVGGAVVSTVVFGLAPALQTTRLDLVRTMRGDVTRDARPRRARHALIALQVGASALLLICAAIFLRSAFAASTKNPGLRTSDTVRFSVETEDRRATLLRAVRAHPVVALVAAESLPARGMIETSASTSRMAVEQIGVSSDYFDVLGIGLVSGRGFTPTERTAEAGVAIVSDILARQLWPNGGAVGQVVRLDAPPASPDAPPPPTRTLTVVGVVRDPRASSATYLDRFRQIYIPTVPEIAGTRVWLRVRDDAQQARDVLFEYLTNIDPTVNTVLTLRTMVGMEAYALQSAFWVTVVLGGLALALTVSGLFSVLSYLVEQQSRDIGVRMALGAATKHVASLMLTQSLRPVVLGLAAGGGLAVSLATALMATPAAVEIGDSVDVFDPVAYAAGVLVIAAACLIAVSVPTLRAARIDPMATLRKD